MEMTRVPPLYEAIALGRHLMSACAGGRTRDKEGFGCALDMALAAVGKNGMWVSARYVWNWLDKPSGLATEEYHSVNEAWISRITGVFDIDVMRRKTMTFDAFVDWVKEIELRETIPVVFETSEGEGIKVPIAAEVHQ